MKKNIKIITDLAETSKIVAAGVFAGTFCVVFAVIYAVIHYTRKRE